ncbi:hypothetical protein, partial [Myxococcus vastator]|uniref:hypothetical protein n=1 Tax=Myxococcus vastator TaxID=2709664 RepID=UPI0019687004
MPSGRLCRPGVEGVPSKEAPRGTGDDATAGSGIIGVAMGGSGAASSAASSPLRGNTKVGALTSSSGDVGNARPLRPGGASTAVGSRGTAPT